MPDLLIRDLDQDVIDKLTFQAALERSTLEMQVHKALREAAERKPDVPLGSIRTLPDQRPSED